MSLTPHTPSLSEVHRSIKIPERKGFWRKMLAYAVPGYLVSVGYIDPGNWATDIAGGSKFGYTLLSRDGAGKPTPSGVGCALRLNFRFK
ncbi:hypothetical protein [Aphanothece hegewaldii]|uniref:hypothetical protein n=1 Tax=Aphanothece hegewaldii TaxID=1521625 RepID=UPI001C6378DE|nr:hypothetical protein [Aphanothece hegewaldii]